MSPALIKIALQVAIYVLKRYYSSLSPEQLAEITDAAREASKSAGSMSSGVGE